MIFVPREVHILVVLEILCFLIVADTGVSVVNKRLAIVSGDVRVTDGVVSAQAGGDTIVSARVDVGDAVVMNTGRGGILQLLVLSVVVL